MAACCVGPWGYLRTLRVTEHGVHIWRHFVILTKSTVDPSKRDH